MKRLLLAAVMLLMVSCGALAQVEDRKRLQQISQDLFTGKYEQVEPEARAYIEEYPESADGHRILGWVALKKDNHEEAETLFKKAIELDPKNDNAYVGLGSIARQAGDLEQAVEYYDQALEVKSDNPEVYGSLVVINILQKEYDVAIANGEKALKYDFDDPTLYANLSVAYHYSGDESNRDKYYQLAESKGYPNAATLQKIFKGEIEL